MKKEDVVAGVVKIGCYGRAADSAPQWGRCILSVALAPFSCHVAEQVIGIEVQFCCTESDTSGTPRGETGCIDALHAKKGLVCVSLQKTGSSTLLHSIQSPTKAHTSTCDARGGQQLCRAAAERVEEVYPIIDRASSAA